MDSGISSLKRPRRIVVERAIQPKDAANKRPNELLTGFRVFKLCEPGFPPAERWRVVLLDSSDSGLRRSVLPVESTIGSGGSVSSPCCKIIQVVFEYLEQLLPNYPSFTKLRHKSWPNNIRPGSSPSRQKPKLASSNARLRISRYAWTRESRCY